MASNAAIVEVVVESMAEIVAADDIEYNWSIPGFKPGQILAIGSLTAGDLIDWSEANEGEAKRTAGLRLITKSLVNKDKVRYAEDPKNILTFRAKSHKATERIVEAILELNGLHVEGGKKVKNG